jgi:hypothetical protein
MKLRKYYLVARKEYNGKFTVFVTDNHKGYEVLKEIDAVSYSEAVKQYSFSVQSNGKSASCGVDVNGNPYHV